MSKPKQFPFAVPEGMQAVPGFSKESFEWMSNAYSEWLHNSNRVQAEVIRFMGDRFSKDVKMMSRFAECRTPEDFFKLQNQIVTEMASDYQQEGAKILALFGEASKEAWSEFTRVADTKRSG